MHAHTHTLHSNNSVAGMMKGTSI